MDSASGLLATLSFSSSIVYTAVPKQIFFYRAEFKNFWNSDQLCTHFIRQLKVQWYLDRGRGHLAGLVKVQRDNLGEAACIWIHGSSTVPKRFQYSVDCLPFLRYKEKTHTATITHTLNSMILCTDWPIIGLSRCSSKKWIYGVSILASLKLQLSIIIFNGSPRVLIVTLISMIIIRVGVVCILSKASIHHWLLQYYFTTKCQHYTAKLSLFSLYLPHTYNIILHVCFILISSAIQSFIHLHTVHTQPTHLWFIAINLNIFSISYLKKSCQCCQRWRVGIAPGAGSWWSYHCHSCQAEQWTDLAVWSKDFGKPTEPQHKYEGPCPHACSP